MDPSGLMGYMDPTQAYQQAALLQVCFFAIKSTQKASSLLLFAYNLQKRTNSSFSKPSSRAGVTCPAPSAGSISLPQSVVSSQPLKRAAKQARPTSPTSSTGEDHSNPASKRQRTSITINSQTNENTGNWSLHPYYAKTKHFTQNSNSLSICTKYATKIKIQKNNFIFSLLGL